MQTSNEESNVWELSKEEGQRISINFSVREYDEGGSREIIIPGHDAEKQNNGRIVEKYSIAEVLAGACPNVYPKSVSVNKNGVVNIDFNQQVDVKIKNLYLSSFKEYSFQFDITVWEDYKPIEKYLIKYQTGCTSIIKYRDNGDDVGTWPIASTTKIP